MINLRFECEVLRASRNRLLELIEISNYEILFRIPDGFNNNVIWQIGHCITSQQRHMYMRSGLPMYISEEFMEFFKIGSSPKSWKTIPDINEVKRLLIDTVNHLESDLKSGLFVNYSPFELPIGFQVKNHVQALQAANYHEAEHSGKIFTYLTLLSHKIKIH
ncbi:DinB family protein [Pedobacter mucosus]|uniref:DinB family protein n=1 Tax=Pedobacter mucosus TaxID=2895286 RepID=UPI001EE47FFF|nr:DinB family protein [Pedobacter mucosus]UKT65612.1 DinB family protein [Pedobacter mucosus]